MEQVGGAVLVGRGAALGIEAEDLVFERLEGLSKRPVPVGNFLPGAPSSSHMSFAAQICGAALLAAPMSKGRPVLMAVAIP